MRLLLDANLSPEVARRLNDSGHAAIHVVEIGREEVVTGIVAGLPKESGR